MIYLGADHRGYRLKEKIKEWLAEWGEEYEDLGNEKFDKKDDFPDFAIRVGEKVALRQAQGKQGLGILLCGSGGMALTANKFKGVRAAEVWNEASTEHAKAHDDINVLMLPTDFVSEEKAKKMIRIWLDTPVKTEEKYVRRLDKIKQLEQKNFK